MSVWQGAVIASASGVIVGIFGPAALVAVLGLVAVGLGMFRWPGLVFAAYLLLPYYKGSLSPYVPGDLTVSLAVMNGLQLIWIVRGGWRHLRREPLIAWLALTMVVVAGAAYAPDREESLPRVAQWLALIVFPSCAALRIISEPRHVRHVIAAVLAMGLLVIVLAIPRIGGEERLVVLEQNTILFAVAALFVPMIGIAYFSVRNRLIEVALLVLVPMSLIVAVASGSRGPPLAAAAVALCALAVSIAKGGSFDRRAAGLIGLGAIGAAVAFVTLGSFPEASIFRYGALVDFLSGPAATTPDSSVGARVDLFGAALRLFAERPIFGHGTGSFASYASGTVGLTDLPYPHNILLQVGAELGVVGLALVVILVASAALGRLPASRSWVAVRLLFAFLFVEGLVSGDLYSDRMLWGLLAMLVLTPSAVSSPPTPAQGI